MKAHFDCCRIAGITATVPSESVAVDSINSQWDAKSLANVIRMTGITRLRVAPPQMTASDLCFDSAVRLMNALDIPPAALDGIVFVSQTPDYQTPATSAVLQHRLGLRQEVVNFDINQGCSGYIYALLQAEMMIRCGLCTNVLVCVGDTFSKVVGPRDRSTRVVFGDAGSATIVTRGSNSDFFTLRTDGQGYGQIIVPSGAFRLARTNSTAAEKEYEDGNFRSQEHLFMDGREVTSFAMREVPAIVDEVLSFAETDKKSVDLYALHQANRFLLDYLARKIGASVETVPFVCGEIGNTAGASIPVLLAVAGAGLHNKNKLSKVVLCGFGVGLSWGAMLTTLTDTQILPLAELSSGGAAHS